MLNPITISNFRIKVFPLTAWLIAVCGGAALATAQTMTLTAYSSDGTNTGIARLGQKVHFTASVTGISSPSITWSTQGAGAISSTGYYTAPSTMPASTSVTVTGTLSSNTAVKASYTLALENPIPAIYSAYTGPGQLQTDFTNPVTVSGAGFVPQSVVYANGSAVPTTYSSAGTLTAQVAVSASATGSVSITVHSPSPGGGTSDTSSIPIAVDHITLYAYTSDGSNTGTVRLGKTAQMTTNITGTPDKTVNWSLSGAGSITTGGLYQAPATLPSSTSVTIKATLSTNPAVSSSYSFSLIFPQPAVYSAYTATGPLTAGTTNSVTVSGDSLVPQSVVLINGSAVPATYKSPGTLTATVPLAAGAQGQVQVAVQNPSPGGNTSPSVALGITPLVLTVAAKSALGQNPGTSRIGLQTQFHSTLTGSGSSSTLAVNWSVSGGGTITSSGLYTAPSTLSAGSTVSVAAKLAANSSVVGYYHLSLLNPVPVITHTSPTQVAAGVPTSVTISGRGFVADTTLTLNGAAIPATFVSANELSASITVPSGQTGHVSLLAQNPDPGAAGSAPFGLPIGSPATVSAQVDVTPGHQIPDDFLGMSYEWGSEASFQGTPGAGINYVYRKLLSNLLQGHSKPMLIRIGGSSSDHSVEPTSKTLPAYSSMAASMPVKFTLGVNLAANNMTLAEDQARYFGANMPSGSLAAIEIGNEGDLYYRWARPSTYTVPEWLQQFSTFGAAITSVVPSTVGLMGPSWGDPNSNKNYFSSFETEEQHVSIATVHGYVVDTGMNPNPTAQSFLSNQASSALPTQDVPYVTDAHQHSQLFRIAEMNSVDNGGKAGVSNSFSAALWAIDTMFEYAKTGVDGVNFHGTGGCAYCQFTFGRFYAPGGNQFNLQYVNPLYYGLLLFQTTTQNNAKLLPVSVSSGPNVKVWAVQDSKGVVRVLVLDKDLAFSGDVEVNVAGFTKAQVLRLAAPSYMATSGATFNGQSFDGSLDGGLVGTPDSEELTASGTTFRVPVQPASAALLTLGN